MKNTNKDAQQLLIANLKKQLEQKQNKYNDILYDMAISSVVDDLVGKREYFDYSNLPYVYSPYY